MKVEWWALKDQINKLASGKQKTLYRGGRGDGALVAIRRGDTVELYHIKVINNQRRKTKLSTYDGTIDSIKAAANRYLERVTAIRSGENVFVGTVPAIGGGYRDGTVGDALKVAEHYFYQKCTPSYASEAVRQLKKDIGSEFHRLPLREISNEHVKHFIARVLGRATGNRDNRRQATKFKTYISMMFQYCALHDNDPEFVASPFRFRVAGHNPTAEVPAAQPKTKRDKVTLELDMIRYLWHDIIKVTSPVIDLFLKLLFATGGQRMIMLREARWEDCDLERRILILRNRKKGSLDEYESQLHVIWLNDQAVEIIHRLKPITGHYKYMFVSRHSGGEQYLTESALRQAVRRLRDLLAREMVEMDVKFAPKHIRHTCKTAMRNGDWGVGMSKLEASIIHDHDRTYEEGVKTRGVGDFNYDNNEHWDETVEPMRKWGAWLQKNVLEEEG